MKYVTKGVKQKDMCLAHTTVGLSVFVCTLSKGHTGPHQEVTSYQQGTETDVMSWEEKKVE